MSFFRVQNIFKEYTSPSKGKTEVYKDFSFVFPKKGLFCFIGSSGCGKTTLLNLIGGVDSPTKGDVFYNGKSIFNSGSKYLQFYKSNIINLIYQDFNLFNDFSVVENLTFFNNNKNNLTKVKEALEKVNLLGYEKRIINNLSGGEKQRVAIARSIIKDTPIIAFDEPTGNLDEKNSKDIFNIIKELSKTKLVIVVSHDIELVKKYSDVIFDIDKKAFVKKSMNYEEDLKKHEKIAETEKIATPKLSIKNSVKYILSLYKNSFLSSTLVFLMLIAQFFLFSNIFSLTFYDTSDAYSITMKKNSWYLLNVQKTIDTGEYNDYIGGFVGPNFIDHEDTLQEYNKLKNKIYDTLPIEKQYFYNINFNNYLENKSLDIPGSEVFEIFEPYNFMHILTINDFDKFYEPIFKGNKPSKTGEILIYDYIADYLYEYGIIGQNIINETIHDYIYDIDLKITGIIQSNYKEFQSIIANEKLTYYQKKYALSRLDDMKKIICTPNTFEYIKQIEFNHYNFNQAFITNDNITYKVDTDIRFINNYDLDLDFTFDYIFDYKGHNINSQNVKAFVISKKLAMKISGIYDEETFDNTSFGTEYKGSEAFVNAFSMIVSSFGYDKSINPELTYDNADPEFLGVLDYSYDEMLFYLGKPYKISNLFDFCKYCILLSNDWGKNKKVISSLKFPTIKDKTFYESQKEDWYEEDFAIYFGYTTFINESEYYLIKVKNMASTITYVLFAVSIICVLIFSFSNIKNTLYKIGILECQGISKRQIFLLYFLGSFLLVLLSFLLSIPLAFILMNSINSSFTSSIAVNLYFFGIKGLSLVVSFAFGFLFVLISLVYPLLVLANKSNIQITNENK